jgi:hypothetical protein
MQLEMRVMGCRRCWPRNGQMNLGRPFKAGVGGMMNHASRQRRLNSTVANDPEKKSILSPGRGDQTIARGERSEPLVGVSIGKSPGRGESFIIFRPSRALAIYHFTRGSLRSPLAIILRRSAAQFSIFSQDLTRWNIWHAQPKRPG